MVDERGGTVEHVLAVVDHDQRGRRAQRGLDARQERCRRLDAQRLGSDRWHVVSARGEREIDETDRQRGLRRGRDCEPGLADTSRSDERHDVASNEPIDNRSDLGGTPDERGSPLGERTGEVARTDERAATRRECWMDEPPHSLGLGEPSQQNDALVGHR